MPRLNHPQSSLASWGDAEVAEPWAGSSRALPALQPEGPDTSHCPQLVQIFLSSWRARVPTGACVIHPLPSSGEQPRAQEEPRFFTATAPEFCSPASCETKPSLKDCRLHNPPGRAAPRLPRQLQALAPVPEGPGPELQDPCVASPLPPRSPNASQRSHTAAGAGEQKLASCRRRAVAWCFQLWSRT